MTTAEALARKQIDRMLATAGWAVQDSFVQNLGFRGRVTVRNYSDTDVYFTAEIGSNEITVTPYNTDYQHADNIIGA